MKTQILKKRLPAILAIGLYIPIILFIGGCSTTNSETFGHSSVLVSQIKILRNGKTKKTRPEMTDICKGFILSEQQVAEFISHASQVSENAEVSNYTVLPCFASGMAKINHHPYKWIIRSGGIGDFTGDGKHFLMICGKQCCNQSPGIC